MNNIKFNPGKIFFCEGDGTPVMLGVVESMEITPTETTIKTRELDSLLLTSRSDEITVDLKLSKNRIDKFLQTVLGITSQVLDIAKDEGYGHVVHLAKYGRKRRTRKKNERRAYRIAQRC